MQLRLRLRARIQGVQQRHGLPQAEGRRASHPIARSLEDCIDGTRERADAQWVQTGSFRLSTRAAIVPAVRPESVAPGLEFEDDAPQHGQQVREPWPKTSFSKHE